MLALLFLAPNNFFLLDEPTNHLDNEARLVIANYLSRKNGFILISHDRYLLDKCVDHILAINRCNIELTSGNFSTWYQNKLNQDRLEIARNEKLKKDIKQREKSAKLVASWADKIEKSKNGVQDSGLKPDKGYVGHKAAKMMQRSKNILAHRQQAIAEKKQLLKNIETTEKLKLVQLDYFSHTYISIVGINIYYQHRQVVFDLNIAINKGDRVAIQGSNGSGKSTVLKLINGEDINYQGKLYKNRQLKISYVAQELEQFDGTLNDYCIKYQIDEGKFKAILAKLEVANNQFHLPISTFSHGQQRKVMLARSLVVPAHLLIWDEPLNYLDVFSRIQIEELIENCKPTIIIVEHDAVFIEKIANKIIHLSKQ